MTVRPVRKGKIIVTDGPIIHRKIKKGSEDMWLPKRGTIRLTLLFVVIILASAISLARFGLRLNRAQIISVQCTIVDKYYDDQGIHDFAYAYQLGLLVDEVSGRKEIIAVSEQSFNTVFIGDVILCDVVYDAKGVIDIHVSDSAIDQYTESERHEDYFLAIIIILCIYAVVGIMLTLKCHLEGRQIKVRSRASGATQNE